MNGNEIICENCGENIDDDVFACTECGNSICEMCACLCKNCKGVFCEACFSDHRCN